MIGKASHNTTADREALRALRQVALFRRLSQEDLANLAAVAHRQCYAYGDYLWGINEAQESVYTMVRGIACICRTTREGCELMLPPLHPGDVFGLFNVEQAIMSEVYAKVMVDGTVLYRLARRHVLRLLESYPEIAVDAPEQLWRWLTDAFEASSP
jgi:CRP/FNR family transcriptional regulator, cyclic AMP receptor protein